MNHTQVSSENGQKLMQQVITEAWDNPEFKAQLVRNPKGTIAQFMGKKEANFNSDKEVVVVDQTDTSKVFITIPPKVSLEDMELSDEQLEAVAGGADDRNFGENIGYHAHAAWDDLCEWVGGFFD